MTGKIRTGFFGGSFNPIHSGHLGLADYLLSNNLLDEIWFVVSPKNPLKPNADPVDAYERLDDVKKAIIGHSGCTASDLEFDLPLPSFTVDTLRHASLLYPERDFILVIGGDNLDIFEEWKEYEYLLRNYDIIVYPRPGATNRIPVGWSRVIMLEAPLMDISSTELREKLNLK